MSAIRIAGFAAASILVGAIGFAQSTSDQSSSATPNAMVKGNIITVTGCLMKESDYRRANSFGKGVFHGAGLGDEYVIVDSATCDDTATATGAAYRPTGRNEKEMQSFLGQRVQATGKLTDNGSAATRKARGELPPEIRVSSFGPAPAAVAEQAAPAPAAPAPAPQVEAQNNAPAPAPENPPAASASEQPVGTSGTALPKTAGDSPLIGLIGLLALGAGISLTLLRRAVATA